MFHFEGNPTFRERKEMTIEGLDSNIADYCGDIYYTSLNLFPGFTLLRQAMLYRQEGFEGVTSAICDDGQPGIWVSQEEGCITDSMRSRVVERFGLSDGYFDAPDNAFLPYMFAHELGHIAQAEPIFTKYFGSLNTERINHTIDYAGYVNCDTEVNADYIAAVIVGNSELGSQIGFLPPLEEPNEWRNWGKTHPIPLTIALNSVEAP